MWQVELSATHFTSGSGYRQLVHHMFSRVLVSENGSLHSTPIAESSYKRKVFRVRESLGKLKRTTDSAALGFLSRLLDTKLDENEKGLFDVSVYLYLLPLSSILWPCAVFICIFCHNIQLLTKVHIQFSH